MERRVTREDFISMYVGCTPRKTNDILQKCIREDRTLIIEDAYLLYEGKDDEVGKEIMDCISKHCMSNKHPSVMMEGGWKTLKMLYRYDKLGLIMNCVKICY